MKTVSALILLLISVPLFSQWSSDPAENTYVREVGFPQQVVSDGRGGIIIGFQANSLMVIRVDSAGYVHWGPLGMFLTENWENYYALDLNLVPLGGGATWASWTDLTGSSYPNPPVFDSLKVRYQRIEPDGSLLFAQAPLVCPVEGLRGGRWDEGSMMVEDGEGGVIIAFQDSRRDTLNYDYVQDIYAQRISNDGEIIWGDSGKLVFGEPNWKRTVYLLKGMISDGFGGAYVLVYRSTNYASEEPDSLYCRLYLQRIDGEGDLLWEEGGVMVRESAVFPEYQRFPEMISDGAGGVYVSLRADSAGLNNNPKLYLQRINSSGILLWGDSGVLLTDQLESSGHAYLVNNNIGGIYVCWSSPVPTGEWNIYGQQFSLEGDKLWGQDGIPISTDTTYKSGPTPILDGLRNVIVIWYDRRNGPKPESDIYGQRLSPEGVRLWDSTDVAISIRPDYQTDKHVFQENGNIFVIWYEIGAGSGFGIFAQLINRNGVLGEPIASISGTPEILVEFLLLQNYPNPFNSNCIIEYSLNTRTSVSLVVYNISGREVVQLVNAEKDRGSYHILWNGVNKLGNPVASGVYFYQLKVAGITQTNKMVLIR